MDIEDCEADCAPFFDAAQHLEALARLARHHLSRNRPELALRFIDRRCRLLVPSARDLFLRALAQRASDRLGEAQRDLTRALELDPADALMNLAALSWGEEGARAEAAARVCADRGASLASRAEAVRTLFAGGERLAHGLHRDKGSIAGWICWASGSALAVSARSARGIARFEVAADPSHPLTAPGISAATIDLHEDTLVASLELTLDAEAAATFTPTAPSRPASQPARRSAAAAGEPVVNVVVPVYEDFEATKACLDALMGAPTSGLRRLVVVDDASPSAPLRAYLDGAQARGALELIRNEVNLGFARSVNAALARCGTGDVLLVNADALLPDGAVERLREAAHSAPDIGTVTPLSNNGEINSYPVPLTANPMPSPAEIAALDAKARRANGAAVVDLPNGVGFCLYIRSACLDAVGPLPELYAQGYYEDVEFCLRASERGFRNVCAPGIFVGHAGSKSFGARKRALVVRNLALLEGRFPDHPLEVGAFLEADPLRAARAALDALSPPEEEIVLLACGAEASHDAAVRRAAQLARADSPVPVLVAATDRSGRRIALRREGGGAPQSLSFDLAEPGAAAGLGDYFARLRLKRVELFDAAAVATPALDALLAAAPSLTLSCGALDWFGQALPASPSPCQASAADALCAACASASTARRIDSAAAREARDKLRRALARADRVAPLDAMGEAFANRVFKNKAEPLERRAEARQALPPAPGPRKLGVLSARPSPAADRLLLRLARALRGGPAQGSIVVFGRAVDDLGLMATGIVFVTGPVAAEDYVDLARRYEVTELASFDRTGGFGDLDEAAAAAGLSKAYFDWSFGAFPAAPGDLVLDPRACAEKAAERIAFWLNSRYPAQT